MEEKNIDLERKKKHMQYAIHTNELEGFVYEPEEIEFLMNVAEGKMSIEEALKIVLES